MAGSSRQNTSRIARNTIMLYIRMFLMMAVTLYTSRVILDVLGVESYGVYNVVGGVVVMLAFFNSSMATSTQRFLNYEMGRQSSRLQNVFTSAVNAQLIIAILTVVVLETAGLWFVETKLVVPDDQHLAALVVYHCAVLTFFITIISTPYNAAIVAHEKMDVYAYFSIFEVILKLGLIYLLYIIPYNKLMVYAILMLLVSVLMRVLYNAYCVKNFAECRYHWLWDWTQIKKLFSFTSWMIFGCIADMFSTQGVNMIINIHFGAIFNAAAGVAVQVRGAVESFSANFMTAVKPQIIKSYSSGDRSYMLRLVYTSSKFSFLLLLAMLIPILLNTETIMNVWLKEVPECAVLFCQLTLVDMLIRSSYVPIAQINQASGKIGGYQLAVSILSISIFAVSLSLFIAGFPVYTTYLVAISIASIGLIARLAVLSKVNDFPALEYLKKVTLPLVPIGICCMLFPFLYKTLLHSHPLITFISTTLIGELVLITTTWSWGLDKSEKTFLINKTRTIICKIKK